MKLLTKTNRSYLLLTTALFALASVVLYFSLYGALRREMEEQLRSRRRQLERHVARGAVLPTTPFAEELDVSALPRRPGYADTLVLDTYEQEWVPYRQLTFPLRVRGQRVWVTLRKSLVETDDVLAVVGGVLLGGLALLLLGVVLLNRWLARRLWVPFRATLHDLRHYSVHQNKVLQFPPTDTDEFAELNQTLTRLSQRLVDDYEAIREFTANAAHETQTPLAIMQAQLEQLLQLPELANPQLAQLVGDLYGATLRLSRLHRALSLLSRIENGQFADSAPLRLDELLTHKAEQLAPLLEARQLRLDLHLTASPTLRMHPGLADSLVHNLLQNAIKHNLRGGTIAVCLTPAYLEISNPGPAITGDPARFFERFRKHQAATDSPGLGLSIVQQIGRHYGFGVTYSFSPSDCRHTLRVQFQARPAGLPQ